MSNKLKVFVGTALVCGGVALYYRLGQSIQKMDDLYSVISYNMYREIQKDADEEFGNITSKFNES